MNFYESVPPMENTKVPFTKIYAYLRKSRADGETSAEEVLAKHEKILQEYCLKTYNAPLPEDHILREVVSGETISGRPVMQKLIRMIEQKEAGAVLCVELQRLSRGDLVDTGELSRLFQYSGCKIITPMRTYDITDEYDRKFFQMELMHGNEYLEYIKKIMDRGRRQSVKEGNYISPADPYGYKRVWIDKRPTLEPVPHEADIVRLIFTWYTGEENLGPQAIADKLNSIGSKPRKADAWNKNSVKNVLQNTLYIGKVTWGKRAEQKEYINGKLVTTRPNAEEYIFAAGKHPALISEEIFNRAQQIRKSRGRPAVRSSKDLVNPLAGLVVCGCCGKHMVYQQQRELPPFLLCHTSHCDIRSGYLHAVMDVLYSSMSATLTIYESQLQNETTASSKNTTITAYEKELDEIKKQQSRLYDLLERGIYTEDVFLERSATLKNRKDSIESELTALRRKAASTTHLSQFCLTLRQCIETLYDESTPIIEKNALLKSCIKKITYHRPRSQHRRWENTPITLDVLYDL